MKKMNVLISILLVLAMAFSLTACAGNQTPSTEAPTTAPKQTDAPTDAPTDPPVETTAPAVGETVVYTINCDNADGWVTDVGAGAYGPFLDVGKIDTENKTEGEGSLYINCDDTAAIGAFLGPSAVFQWTGDPVETGLNIDNAAIRMSIYVSSPDVVKIASKLQVGSAGMPDVDNFEFIFGNDADQSVCTHTDFLESGWNEVTLKLTDAWKVGSPDLNAINFIKFYSLIVPEGSEVRIDNIQIVNLGN